jgi:hypothetical protein
MVGQEDNKKSMHNRISSILSRNRSEQRDFGAWNQAQAEDAEEIEYLLARAEADLRKAQARVDELKLKLTKSQ